MHWFAGSVSEAIVKSRSSDAYFVVYVKGLEGDQKSHEFTSLLDTPTLSNILDSDRFVKIQLTLGSPECNQFSQIYPVIVVPSLYFIDQQGTPVEVVGGNIAVEVLEERIRKLAESIRPIEQVAATTTSATVPSLLVLDAGNTNLESQSIVVEETSESPSIPISSPPLENIAVTESIKSETSQLSPEIIEPNSSEHEIQGSSVGEEASSRSGENLEAVGSQEMGENSESRPTLEEKIEKARKLAEAIRLKKEKEEKEKERRLEIERRDTLKNLQKFKKEQEEKEMKELADQRKKEKEADRLAREKVKKQIEQDRLDKAARFNTARASEVVTKKEEDPTKVAEQQAKASADAAARSQNARIQFRFPDGTTRTETFPGDTNFGEVRRFVEQQGNLPFRNFRLTTAFPRREFGPEDSSKTLRELQLVPSSAILVIPADSIIQSRGGSLGLSLTALVRTILAPVFTIYGYIRLFLFGTPIAARTEISPPPNKKAKPNTQPKMSDNEASHSERKGEEDGSVRRRIPGADKNFRRDGNIHRLVDQVDDDSDDNNTWNGNSTQQM